MSRIQNQTEHLEYQIWEAGLQTRNPVWRMYQTFPQDG
jgi:hypothetical protein